MECGGVEYKGVCCILVSHFIGFLLWFLNDCWLISKVVWFGLEDSCVEFSISWFCH